MARPKGALNKVNATAKSIALAALSSVDQVELWRKHLLNEDPLVSIAALTYLTDRVAGKPSQVVKGDPDNPHLDDVGVDHTPGMATSRNAEPTGHPHSCG